MEERPSVEERYLGAVTSSHLRLNLDKAGSVDILVAAGWVRETLATSLYRLRGEFDHCKGNVRREQTNYRLMHAKAAEWRELAEAQRAREKYGPTLAAKYEREADAFATQAENEALTARALILMQLKSLHGVTNALRHFGEQQAPRQGYKGIDVMRVTGKALELALDPLCPYCDGVGAFGGYGKARMLCKKCKGSTRRRVDFGSIEAQGFGMFLLADMERKLARVDGLMLKFMSRMQHGDDVPLDPSLVTSTHVDLKKRLADLRSVDANSD